MPSKCVLIIDDHPDSRAICRELLTHFGYQVIEAEDGEAGIRLAIEHGPDLVLLDYFIPNDDIKSTLARLRTEPPIRRPRIVLYTAAATEHQELGALEGVDRILLKPVEVKHLLEVVRDLINGPDREVPAGG